MKNIEKPVGNALSEWLGAERVEELKDKIVEKILEQVEYDLQNQYNLTVDAEMVNELATEAFEEVSKKIKKMYKETEVLIQEQLCLALRPLRRQILMVWL